MRRDQRQPGQIARLLPGSLRLLRGLGASVHRLAVWPPDRWLLVASRWPRVPRQSVQRSGDLARTIVARWSAPLTGAQPGPGTVLSRSLSLPSLVYRHARLQAGTATRVARSWITPVVPLRSASIDEDERLVAGAGERLAAPPVALDEPLAEEATGLGRLAETADSPESANAASVTAESEASLEPEVIPAPGVGASPAWAPMNQPEPLATVPLESSGAVGEGLAGRPGAVPAVPVRRFTAGSPRSDAVPLPSSREARPPERSRDARSVSERQLATPAGPGAPGQGSSLGARDLAARIVARWSPLVALISRASAAVLPSRRPADDAATARRGVARQGLVTVSSPLHLVAGDPRYAAKSGVATGSPGRAESARSTAQVRQVQPGATLAARSAVAAPGVLTTSALGMAALRPERRVESARSESPASGEMEAPSERRADDSGADVPAAARTALVGSSVAGMGSPDDAQAVGGVLSREGAPSTEPAGPALAPTAPDVAWPRTAALATAPIGATGRFAIALADRSPIAVPRTTTTDLSSPRAFLPVLASRGRLAVPPPLHERAPAPVGVLAPRMTAAARRSAPGQHNALSGRHTQPGIEPSAPSVLRTPATIGQPDAGRAPGVAVSGDANGYPEFATELPSVSALASGASSTVPSAGGLVAGVAESGPPSIGEAPTVAGDATRAGTGPGVALAARGVALRVDTATAREWPVLRVLSRPASMAQSATSSALRMLRTRMPLARRTVTQALASLPSLGPGEPLESRVRAPMESILGRDLARIRLHVSPVAEMLGAAAFTTGERLVFAPGRLDMRSPAGLALIGHELAHVGTALAFKRLPGAGPVDEPEERFADEQAAAIQRIAEQGWPGSPPSTRMEVRRATQLAPASVRSVASSPLGPEPATGVGVAAAAVQRAEAGATGSGGAGGVTPAARFSAAQAAEAEQGPAGPDVGALARQVYDILKGRLRAERERHQVYSR
jgi:hypothetical protein